MALNTPNTDFGTVLRKQVLKVVLGYIISKSISKSFMKLKLYCYTNLVHQNLPTMHISIVKRSLLLLLLPIQLLIITNLVFNFSGIRLRMTGVQLREQNYVFTFSNYV